MVMGSKKRMGRGCAAMVLPMVLGAMLTRGADAQTNASADDKHFLKEIAEDSNFEIKTGQLAIEKGTSQDVKAYGAMLVRDHTELKRQIRSADAAAKVPPAGSDSMTLADHAEYDKLKLLSGDAFEKAFIKGLVKGNDEIQKDEKAEAVNSTLAPEKSLAAHSADLDTKHADKAKLLAQAHHMQP